jgi:hypothetical protein
MALFEVLFEAGKLILALRFMGAVIWYFIILYFVFALQSYEKLGAKQRNIFLFLPRRSNFTNFIGKLAKKMREIQRENSFFFSFPSVCDSKHDIAWPLVGEIS